MCTSFIVMFGLAHTVTLGCDYLMSVSFLLTFSLQVSLSGSKYKNENTGSKKNRLSLNIIVQQYW